jgi:hypothetical protein
VKIEPNDIGGALLLASVTPDVGVNVIAAETISRVVE